jgi:hypothetical protein
VVTESVALGDSVVAVAFGARVRGAVALTPVERVALGARVVAMVVAAGRADVVATGTVGSHDASPDELYV